MSEKHPIKIRCPHCFEDNSINLSKEINCQHCEKSLINERYIKPIVTGMATFAAAAIIGIGSGIAIDEHFEVDRYPISVEYSIINNCISAYDAPLRIRYLKNKKYICECALENTEKKIHYDEYKENQMAFLNEFEKQALLVSKKLRER